MNYSDEEDMYLIVSEGVTAIIASIIPAPRPANIDLGADSRPFISAMITSHQGMIAYLVVTEHLLELIICRKPHARFDCISHDNS